MTALLQKSVTVTEPTVEPLTLAEAKKHLEIADADDAHDAHVGSLIAYARQKFEDDTGRFLIIRSVVEKQADWGCWPWRLRYRPAVSVTHVKYYSGGSLATYSSGDYSLDAGRGLVHLDYDAVAPTYDDRWDAIQVTYTAGYGSNSQNVPDKFKHPLKLLIENAFDDRHKDATTTMDAYENIIRNYLRPTYP